MPASDDLYPPVQYAPGWLLLALGVIVLVLAAVWLVLLFTRPRAGGGAPPRPVVADAVAMLRQELGSAARRARV
mgnify:CR=1 FL=1